MKPVLAAHIAFDNIENRMAQQTKNPLKINGFLLLAEWTGLEPATPGVTGRYSNQLNYHSTNRSARTQYELTASNYLVGAEGLEPPTFAL